MGSTGTTTKPAAAGSAPAPTETPAQDATAAGVGALLAEIRAQGAAMMADAQASATAMIEAARAESARVTEEARSALEDARVRQELAAAETPAEKARLAVDVARKDFEVLTTGDGRVWLQHEADPDFIPVSFRAIGPRWKQSELRVLRIPRHEYTHMGRTETSPGVAYQFSHGEFEALSADVEAYLRSRPGFDVLYEVVGEEKGSAPDTKLIQRQILEATIDMDDDVLRELWEKEQVSHKRVAVLTAIRDARILVRDRTGATQGDG